MQTYRVYTDGEGQSHFEIIDLGAMTSWFEGLPATEIKFHTFRVGEFLDWHPAPYRLFGAILSGSLEIGVTDGGKKGSRTECYPADERYWKGGYPYNQGPG